MLSGPRLWRKCRLLIIKRSLINHLALSHPLVQWGLDLFRHLTSLSGLQVESGMYGATWQDVNVPYAATFPNSCRFPRFRLLTSQKQPYGRSATEGERASAKRPGRLPWYAVSDTQGRVSNCRVRALHLLGRRRLHRCLRGITGGERQEV